MHADHAVGRLSAHAAVPIRWRAALPQSVAALCCVIAIVFAARATAQPTPTASLLLTNGRIVTVDERFSIAEAVAVAGEEIVAVGGNDEIAAFGGPDTRSIDLEGRTVIPGLIDNHMHLLRAGATWSREVRLDGIGSRRRALRMLRDKADAVPLGAWIATLGGWTVDQFADDDSPLTRDELDAAVPEHPVLLQASYYRGYLNSRALEAFGLDDASAPAWAVRGAEREIEDSGITWGFGSDGSRANQVLPFATLAWAVTGRMVGGRRVLAETETIDREAALIAHTRKNAYLIFQEDRLGSIEPGKLADLVVLDRDYLSVPAGQIRDIRPVMTIVGGRVVHERPTGRESR